MSRFMTAGLASFAFTAVAFGQVADLRVVHASPDAPSVDVYVDGGLVVSDLPFNEATPYLTLFPGDYRVQVAPTGTQTFVIDEILVLDNNKDYTVAAVNPVATIGVQVYEDDNSLNVDDASVRFVHLSPDAPEVDIKIAGGPVIFGSITYLDFGGYQQINPGIYDLEVRVSSSQQLVLELPDVQLDAGTVYSIFATGFAGGSQPALDALVTVDNLNRGLTLEIPFAPQANADNLFRLSGMSPGDTAGFAYSLALGSTRVPGCSNLFLDLGRPTVVASGDADNLGELNFEIFVPRAASGRLLYFQGANVERCSEVSNLVTAQF